MALEKSSIPFGSMAMVQQVLERAKCNTQNFTEGGNPNDINDGSAWRLQITKRQWLLQLNQILLDGIDGAKHEEHAKTNLGGSKNNREDKTTTTPSNTKYLTQCTTSRNYISNLPRI